MLSSRQVINQFTHWTISQAKAYTAGANAAIRSAAIVKAAAAYADEDPFEDDLTLFFYRGAADAIGDEAEAEEWFEEIQDWRIEYRWWGK